VVADAIEGLHQPVAPATQRGALVEELVRAAKSGIQALTSGYADHTRGLAPSPAHSPKVENVVKELLAKPG
jgi:hypothetical protein